MQCAPISSNFTVVVPCEDHSLKSFNIPNEIGTIIFSKADIKTVASIACTCKNWNILANGNPIWIAIAKHLDYKVNPDGDIAVKLQVKNLVESRPKIQIEESPIDTEEVVESFLDMFFIFVIKFLK